MSGRSGSGVTRRAVLGHLIREADLDGLATIAEREIGDALGVTSQSVGYHIRNLAADGVVTVLPNAAGYKSMSAIQLSETAEDYYAESGEVA